MKLKIVFILILIFTAVPSLFAANNYHYGRHPELECVVTPMFSELPTGEIATFSVSIRNRTDKPIELNYKTGQEWDLVILQDKQQIYRWSSIFKWHEKSFSHPLKPGETKSALLSWKAVNRYSKPVLQGVYTARGIAMLEPKHIVSEDLKFRIIPPTIIKKETYKVKLNQLFELKVPARNDQSELSWRFDIKHKNNRLGIRNIKRDKEKVTILMHPKRLGYVEFDLIGCPTMFSNNKSTERRSYRIEIVADLD